MANYKPTDAELHQSLIDKGYKPEQGKPNTYWKPGSKDVYTDGEWTSSQNSSSWEKHTKNKDY
jgi:hypothetical protein